MLLSFDLIILNVIKLFDCKKICFFFSLGHAADKQKLKFTAHRRKLFKKVKPDCKLREFLEVEINNPMDENFKKHSFYLL